MYKQGGSHLTSEHILIRVELRCIDRGHTHICFRRRFEGSGGLITFVISPPDPSNLRRKPASDCVCSISGGSKIPIIAAKARPETSGTMAMLATAPMYFAHNIKIITLIISKSKDQMKIYEVAGPLPRQCLSGRYLYMFMLRVQTF